MDKIGLIEKDQVKKEIPSFNVGDIVTVYMKHKEADKVRIYPFEGTVIRKKGKAIRLSFTVRKLSYGEGIERTFPIYSPNIEKIELIRKGKVRRAKLYYLRKRIGKKAKVASAS